MRNLACLLVTISIAANLAGCSSTSGKTYAELNRASFEYHTDRCQAAIRATEVHEDIKLIRTLVSPVAVALSGGLLLPAVFAANVGMDTVDRVDASRMEQHCGGKGKSSNEIAQGVATGAAISLAAGAVGGMVASGTPIASSVK